MKSFNYFAFLCCLLTTLYGSGLGKSGCLERKEALTLLETAEDFLSKADDAYPTCKNKSECGGKLPLAFIEISKNLISNVRENFPTCPKLKNVKPSDCSEISPEGRNESGLYLIWIRESPIARKPLLAYCDMDTKGGGWTVVQRRGKFPVQQDFYQNWEKYKNGFGSLTEEFWFGNENIRLLCLKGCKIRFDLKDQNGTKGFAEYDTFFLLGSNYTLYISNYSGDVGDSMKYHHNYAFSTKDVGVVSRANRDRGGWWYYDGGHTQLNGVYQPGKSGWESVFWWTWRRYDNLASVEIKVKPMSLHFSKL